MRKFLKYMGSSVKTWPNSVICPRNTGRIEVDVEFLGRAGASITDGQKSADEKIRTLNADLATRVAELEAAKYPIGEVEQGIINN